MSGYLSGYLSVLYLGSVLCNNAFWQDKNSKIKGKKSSLDLKLEMRSKLSSALFPSLHFKFLHLSSLFPSILTYNIPYSSHLHFHKFILTNGWMDGLRQFFSSLSFTFPPAHCMFFFLLYPFLLRCSCCHVLFFNHCSQSVHLSVHPVFIH